MKNIVYYSLEGEPECPPPIHFNFPVGGEVEFSFCCFTLFWNPPPDTLHPLVRPSLRGRVAHGAVRTALQSSPTERQSVRDRPSARTHASRPSHTLFGTNARADARDPGGEGQHAETSCIFASNSRLSCVSSSPPMRGLYYCCKQFSEPAGACQITHAESEKK